MDAFRSRTNFVTTATYEQMQMSQRSVLSSPHDGSQRSFHVVTPRVEEQHHEHEHSLVHALDDSGCDQKLVEKIESLAAAGRRWWHAGSNPKFFHSIELGCRVAVVCAVAGCLDARALDAMVPETWRMYLPSIIPAIVLSVKDNLATTMMFTLQITIGVMFAAAHAYFISHVLQENSYACALVDYGLFSFFVLWLNIAHKVKVFTLTWTPVLVMQFANPEVDFRSFLVFQWGSGMVAILVVQCVGATLALLAMLLPYPVTALAQARVMGARTAEMTTRMYMFVAKYYCRVQPDLSIHIWRSELARLRNLELSMGGIVEIAWWEGFGLCNLYVRKLLAKHQQILRELTRQLNIIHVCAVREDFAESHVRVMTPVEQTLMDLVIRMGELLMSVTIAANDGTFDDEEMAENQTRIDGVNDFSKRLAAKWQKVRTEQSRHGIGLAKELRTESFFIYEVTKCSRLVAELATAELEMSSSLLELGVLKSCKSVFDRSKLFDRHHLNFVFRNWLSLNLAFLLGMLVWEFDPTVPGFVALMLSEKPGAALLTNLGRMTGTVLGTLIGFVLYKVLHSCDQVVERCLALFFFEWGSNFLYYYSDQFAHIGALLAVFGGKILITKCEENLTPEDNLKLEAAGYLQFHKLAVALGLVSLVDIIFLRKAASVMARECLLEVMKECFDLFKDCLNTGVCKESDVLFVKAHFDRKMQSAESFGAEAQQEPRWWRAPFKAVLFRQLCVKMRSIHLDLITIQEAFEGDSGQLLFMSISNKRCFPRMKKDVFVTIDDVERIVGQVLRHEKMGVIDVIVSDWTSSINTVDGLEALIDEVREDLLQNPPKPATTMEEDLVCRVCVVYEMLDRVVKDIAATLMLCLENL